MIAPMRFVLALVSTVLLGGVAVAYEQYLTTGGVPIRWYELELEVGVATVPMLDPGAAMNAVDASIAAWTAIDCDGPAVTATLDADAVIDDADGRNSVVWFTNGAAWGERFSAAELARTLVIHKVRSGTIVEADIAVNLGGFAFSAGASCELGRYDLQSALTHEFGHFFGLDHSLVTSATMAPRSEPGDCELRTLDADDIAGFCATYDRPAEVEPTPEPEPEVSESAAEEAIEVEAIEVEATEPDRPRKDEGCTGGGPVGLIGLFGFSIGRARRGRRATG